MKHIHKDVAKFRRILAEAGFEFTMDEVQESIEEAVERNTNPPGDICLSCGEKHFEFRFGCCPHCVLGTPRKDQA